VLEGLAPARRRFVLAVVALVAVTLAVTGVAVWAARDQPTDPVPQATPGPVLLVPGYGGSERELQRLSATLSADGRDVSIVHLAGDGTGDLRDQVPVLDDAAHSALRRTDAPDVDVVGYSAGGIVARLWATAEGAGLVRRVVMLGTPNHGTDLAGLASDIAPDMCPAACRQLAPDSELIRALNAGDEAPSGPTWVSIWSEADHVVFPPESASLDGALDFSVQSVCAGVGDVSHGELPSNVTVGRLVHEELGAGPPKLPTAADC
jgi:triacylglycerol lipase